MHLGIDPLSALFLAALAPQILATAIADTYRSSTFWVAVAGMVLALLGTDAFSLIFGVGSMCVAAWLLVPRAIARPPTGVAAVINGGGATIGLYVILRYGFVVFGTASQGWWGSLLSLAGAAGALIGARRAMLEPDIRTMLEGTSMQQIGLIVTGIGIALRAKAMGDPALAALALQAALLGTIAHAVLIPLMFIGAGAVKAGTGTGSLDWLGGLIRGMPVLGGLMLAGAIGVAGLPFGPGFAPLFLLLHAVFAAASAGGMAARVGFAVLAAALGLAAALAVGAAVRLIGIGFLGRPRTLRAAAAAEAAPAVLWGMALLAACCLPMAFAPGLILRAIQPAIAVLVPGAPALNLKYAPLSLAVLLLLPAGAVWSLLRRFGARRLLVVPAWNGGFGKPPVWMPFGDPKTQISATGFAEPLRRVLADDLSLPSAMIRPRARFWRTVLRRRSITSRQHLAFVLGTLVLVLAMLGMGLGG